MPACLSVPQCYGANESQVWTLTRVCRTQKHLRILCAVTTVRIICRSVLSRLSPSLSFSLSLCYFISYPHGVCVYIARKHGQWRPSQLKPTQPAIRGLITGAEGHGFLLLIWGQTVERETEGESLAAGLDGTRQSVFFPPLTLYSHQHSPDSLHRLKVETGGMLNCPGHDHQMSGAVLNT